MVLGPWGTLWRFVVLTTGIGAASGLVYMVYEAVRGLFEYGLYMDLVSIGGIVGGVGAGIGLIMGFPAYLVVRLSVARLHSRFAAGVFFLVLGFASAVVPWMIWFIADGTFIEFISTAGNESWLFIIGLAIPAGILTSACSFLFVRPAHPQGAAASS